MVADDFQNGFNYFSEKLRLGISCELSNLVFSEKKKKKKKKLSSAVLIVIYTLRVK